jgi:hypothetical protein
VLLEKPADRDQNVAENQELVMSHFVWEIKVPFASAAAVEVQRMVKWNQRISFPMNEERRTSDTANAVIAVKLLFDQKRKTANEVPGHGAY